MLCTNDSNLVFQTTEDFGEKNQIFLKAFQLKKTSKPEKIFDYSLCDIVGSEFHIETAVVHYFTEVRVYVTTTHYLFIICPFRKHILARMTIPRHFYDHVLHVNWSGEEILLTSLMEDVRLIVFKFIENRDKPSTLSNLVKTFVLANFTVSQMESCKLPKQVNALLGIL